MHGILEGDGYVAGGKARFGLGIVCHQRELPFTQSILTQLGIHSRVDDSDVKNAKSNRVVVQFFLFEVLSHLQWIGGRIFSMYPKRRKEFIMRLLDLPSVRFLLGSKATISSYSLGQIKKYNINDDVVRLLRSLSDEII